MQFLYELEAVQLKSQSTIGTYNLQNVLINLSQNVRNHQILHHQFSIEIMACKPA